MRGKLRQRALEAVQGPAQISHPLWMACEYFRISEKILNCGNPEGSARFGKNFFGKGKCKGIEVRLRDAIEFRIGGKAAETRFVLATYPMPPSTDRSWESASISEEQSTVWSVLRSKGMGARGYLSRSRNNGGISAATVQITETAPP